MLLIHVYSILLNLILINFFFLIHLLQFNRLMVKNHYLCLVQFNLFIIIIILSSFICYFIVFLICLNNYLMISLRYQYIHS
jgi:hypothetical protein